MSEEPSVIVLGARGRFGRAASRAFSAAGWRVTLAVRPGGAAAVPGGAAAVPGGAAAVPGGHATVEVDATDADALARAATGQELIVNALNPPYDRWASEVPRLTAAVLRTARTSGATVLLPGNVYNFGPEMPRLLDEHTPRFGVGKGRLRVELEQAYRDAGVPTIVLRAGDFIERERTGNWFDTHVAHELDKGRVTYPGPLEVVHSWAYLPDLARAAVGLAARRAELPSFADVPFPGYALTGRELASALERVVGRPLQVRAFPWWMLGLLAPFKPLLREVVEMRYLWQVPHALSGDALARWLPGFEATPLEVALAEATGRASAPVG
jgi:nucleoside-diphosphate-sugar epimerase